jgi:hypothetical protein
MISVVAAAVFAAGLTATAAIPASAAKTAPVLTVISQRQVRVPVFYKWRFATPKVRPSLVAWGSGSGLFVKNLRWDHWRMTGAYGRGTRWANTCNPTCSAGNYIKSPASITFWRWRWHEGHRYWTRLTLRWTRNGTHHKHVYVHSNGQFDTGDWP